MATKGKRADVMRAIMGGPTTAPASTTAPRAKVAPATRTKRKVTLYLAMDLLADLRAIAYHEPGASLAALVDEGLRPLVTRYQTARRKATGADYPTPGGALPRGRRIGV